MRGLGRQTDRREDGQGILIAALGVLAGHYGSIQR